MHPVIEVYNISKRFTLNHNRDPYQTFRESLYSIFNKGVTKEEFWALRNVTFDVQKGESYAIIGKNGAGKSTLLKILSKITPPTKGKITIRGRVASLLEVGTGFHMELTGRENIFFNGSILGLKKKEIKDKFDEIVDFSGVEKFLDTPLKRYSSGMQLRLAFSVAAHLEPEILVIDEVLSVGDAEFQKKCLGKMKEVSTSGRTVLFVSHNMTAINSLCSQAVLLEKGFVKTIGSVSETIELYLKGGSENSPTKKNWLTELPTYQDEIVKLKGIRLTDIYRNDLSYVNIDEKTGIELSYEILQDGYKPVPNIHIFSTKGEKAFVAVEPTIVKEVKKGNYVSTVWIPENFLNEGSYIVGVALSSLNPVIVHAHDYESFTFDVVDDLNAITRNEYKGAIDGIIRPLLVWETKIINK